MKVQHNVQLKDKTTFMVPAIAETYIELGSVEDVDGLISSNLLSRNKYFIYVYLFFFSHKCKPS